MSEILKGKVKFFDKAKGFGFIQPDNGSADVFVHITAVRDAHYDDLAQGDVVEFVKKEGKKPGKFQAENLRIVN